MLEALAQVFCKRTCALGCGPPCVAWDGRVPTRSLRGGVGFVAQIDFVLRDTVPNTFIRVNPLGVQITYFRVDQAFSNGGTDVRQP